MSKSHFAGLMVLLLACAFVFIACDDGSGSTGGSGNLPIKTIKWEKLSDGYTQFYTNDSKNYDYGFWNVLENGNKNTYEIDCKKLDGDQGTAYGMIFGVSNTDLKHYYSLWISCGGYYCIWKYEDTEAAVVRKWTKINSLNQGYDTINNLKVINSGSDYSIYINGNEIDQFSDDTIFGSRIGFYAEVSSETYENFPNRPVDIRFKKK